jgi:hypothetical protein
MRNQFLAAALLACVGVASAGVTVKYDDPSKFQDMPHNDRDRTQVLKDLSEHFAKLGRKLPPGQDLIITIKDIDLAGREEPSRRRIDDIRILRGGADWPSMQIQYTLEQNGQVIKSGDERVSNMMYLNRINRYDNDNLKYEKQMLDDWFREKFEPQRVSRNGH